MVIPQIDLLSRHQSCGITAPNLGQNTDMAASTEPSLSDQNRAELKGLILDLLIQLKPRIEDRGGLKAKSRYDTIVSRPSAFW